MKPKTPSPKITKYFLDNFRYDPETGEFWRKVGHQRDFGYQAIILGIEDENGKKARVTMRAPRLAYLLMTGEPLPEDRFMDHISGDTSDDRWANLRVSSAQQNSRNRRGWGAVKSRGVTLVVRKGGLKYRSQIGTYPNVKRLGDFDTEEEAANAYDIAARERYGEFARTNK